jgi:aminocarboxymuconate-semialdehyde decarboxylase
MAIGMVTPQHLLLGSDAPFPLGEPDPVNFVRKSLQAEAAEMILSTNYARIFGD